MNITIAGKQFELTDAIKDYINQASESLSKYNLDIISVRIVISADEKKGKKGFAVEFAINLAKQNTIVIKQNDKDLYAGVDIAIDRANKVLRRYHDKNVSSKQKDKDARSEFVEKEVIEGIDEIIPMELELYKPLEIEEALELLKASDKQFYAFNDIDAKMRVIYKRSDGAFGLY